MCLDVSGKEETRLGQPCGMGAGVKGPSLSLSSWEALELQVGCPGKAPGSSEKPLISRTGEEGRASVCLSARSQPENRAVIAISSLHLHLKQ